MYYFLPFTYYKLSRLNSITDLLSWFIIYPLFLYLFYANFSDFQVNSMLAFFLSFVAFFSIYEVGYLENDIITTETENSPTDRLGTSKGFFKKKYYKLIFSRYFISILLVATIHICDFFSVNSLLFLILYFFVVRFFFFLHNKIRNKLNIVTYFSLAISRYALPVVLLYFDGIGGFEFLLVVTALFPLLRTIEHSSKPKYGMPFNHFIFSNLDYLRVCYYALLSLIFYFYYYDYLVFSLAFLSYRVATLFIAKFSRIKRTISSSYLK